MAVFAPGDTSNTTGDPGWWAGLDPAIRATMMRMSQYAGGGAPPPSALSDAQAQLAAGSPPNSNAPPTLGPVAPIQQAATIPPILPPVSTGGGGPTPPSGSGYGDPRLWGASYPHMPWPDTGVAPAAVPTPPARPVTPTPATAYSAAPAATQPSRPVTPTPATAYSPGFGGIDRQNLSASGWNPGTRQGTALDLSSLFGMPSDVNPANVPTANAQPVSGGALSKAGTKGLSKAPWDYGPKQSTDARIARLNKSRYG